MAPVVRGTPPALGSGSGSGSGSGYGYVDGYGYGYGDGYGDGDGSGSGYGDGDGYWQAILGPHTKPAATVAFWKSDKDGRPCNGGHSTVAKVGLVEELPGPLKICSYGFHATKDPAKWKGERLWIVALYGEIQEQDDKVCALKREFIAEVEW